MSQDWDSEVLGLLRLIEKKKKWREDKVEEKNGIYMEFFVDHSLP